MLLYNVVLGNQQLTPEKFSHTIDEYGTHYIAKDDIHQRMRIDRNVDPNTYPSEGELTPVWSSANIQCYSLLPNTRWANNNRNMNPMILNKRKNDDQNNEQYIIYLTVSNNYAIIRFNTDHHILQTYHKKDIFQGCVIVVNKSDLDDNNKAISIKVYDKKKGQFAQFTVAFMKNDHTKILIQRKNVTDKKLLGQLSEQFNKFKNRYMGFKIITKPEELLTVAYVVSEKYKDDIIKKVSGLNKPLICVIKEPVDMKDETYRNYVLSELSKEFSESHIRAITQCGINLPLEIVRELRLLYVFNYDLKNDVLSCKKSN